LDSRIRFIFGNASEIEPRMDTNLHELKFKILERRVVFMFIYVNLY